MFLRGFALCRRFSSAPAATSRLFAVVDIKGSQFKVSRGDRVTTQLVKLNDADVDVVRSTSSAAPTSAADAATPSEAAVTAHHDALDVGTRVAFRNVLMLGDATRCVIGTPLLPSARVVAVVEEVTRADKVIVFKKRRRKKSQRTQGHRQWVSVLRIDEVIEKEAAE